MSTSVAHELDVRGLTCPLPIVKTARAVKGLAPGELVEVLATDPGSVPDFATWCRSTGNQLLATSLEGGVYRFIVRKGYGQPGTPG